MDYLFTPTPMLRWCDTHGDAIHIYRLDRSEWLCRKCMVARMFAEEGAS